LTQNHSLGNLRSITIEKHRTPTNLPTDQSNQAQVERPVSRISMPFLREIFLDGILVQEVNDLLALFLCPSLEAISLDWIKSNRHGPGLSNDLLSLDSPLDLPRLASLNIKNLDSLQSLYCLRMFVGLRIEKLSMSITKYQPDWISQRDTVLITLSRLHIQDLALDGTYWVNHCILTSMGAQDLTVLDVEFDWKNEPKEPLTPADQDILFPRLRKLRFRGAEDHLLHFLSLLEAEHMDTFEADVGGNDTLEGEWDREQALQTMSNKTFASVQVAELTFADVTQCLPHLKLFPNLHKLRITTGSDTYTHITDDDATIYLVNKVLQPLCEALNPTISGGVSLPRLGSIYASCDSTVYDAEQPAEWSDDARGEVCTMLHEMLARRAEASGWTLELEPVRFDCEYNSEYRYETATVEFGAQ